MSDQIPPQVETFVSDCIGSIAELELLLLLADDPSKAWTADEAARALYVTPGSVETILGQMRGRGLLTQSADGYRFATHSAEQVATVKGLKEMYATRRLKVMEMIYAGPSEKYQSFADAFRLRKNP
jgi:DNA-binding MarR family transcriptional regulator